MMLQKKKTLNKLLHICSFILIIKILKKPITLLIILVSCNQINRELSKAYYKDLSNLNYWHEMSRKLI